MSFNMSKSREQQTRFAYIACLDIFKQIYKNSILIVFLSIEEDRMTEKGWKNQKFFAWSYQNVFKWNFAKLEMALSKDTADNWRK